MKHLMLFVFLIVGHNVLAEVTFNKPQKGTIQINEDLQITLSKWDAEFKVFPLKSYPPTVIGLFRDAAEELPMAAAGDFNGDGQKDYALMGYTRTQQKVIILLKQEKGYTPIVVSSEKYKDPTKSVLNNEDTGKEKGLSVYISLLPSKDIQVGKKSTFKQTPDALQIENYGGVTNAYYLKVSGKNKIEVKEYKGMINE